MMGGIGEWIGGEEQWERGREALEEGGREGGKEGRKRYGSELESNRRKRA